MDKNGFYALTSARAAQCLAYLFWFSLRV